MKRQLPLGITGFGLLSSLGEGLEQTKRTLFARAPEVRALDPERPWHQLPTHEAWYHRFDLAHDISLCNLFARVATEEALAMAGLSLAELRRLRVGVCLGSTVGGGNYQAPFAQSYFRGEFPDPAPLHSYLIANSAQFLARHLDVRGPVQLVNNACTSGADAITIAASWLRADLCDVAICGGTETVVPGIYSGFKSLMLCAPENCQPFDRRRQGLTLGEGAGILVMEKSVARRAPKGWLLGAGMGSDAFHPTSPDPETRGLEIAVQQALAQSDRKLNEIDFLNAHATGTTHNDLSEGRWVQQRAPHLKVIATKGYTGHTLGAAGGVEAVLTLLSLREGRLPQSLGFAEADAEIGIVPTTESVQGDFQLGLSTSLGFGGTNAALLFQRSGYA